MERALLRHVLRNTAYSPPANLYVALFSGNPGPLGTGAPEIAGNGYSRVVITFADVAGTGDPGAALNAQVVFPQATPTGWGLVTHFGIFDAITAGNFLMFGALTNSKTVGASDTFRFPSNNLSVQFVQNS